VAMPSPAWPEKSPERPEMSVAGAVMARPIHVITRNGYLQIGMTNILNYDDQKVKLPFTSLEPSAVYSCRHGHRI
jgi:hypothetical protein